MSPADRTYYNEFDANAAAWLRGLGTAGEIAPGEVDERSIKDVRGSDLAGVRRAHFFAGIGGWDLALRLAGWPDDEEVWTGSCPCQPYSSAGKQEGDADPRNLWPDFFRLIQERRPQSVFGEQVASAIKHGWLDRVFADLEGIGYTCGAAVLGAHSVGANHIRKRLYWGASLGRFPDIKRSERRPQSEAGINFADGENERRQEAPSRSELHRATGGLQHAASDGRLERGAAPSERGALGGRGPGRICDSSGDDVGRDTGGAPGAKTESDSGGRKDGSRGVVPGSTGDAGGLPDGQYPDGRPRERGAEAGAGPHGIGGGRPASGGSFVSMGDSDGDGRARSEEQHLGAHEPEQQAPQGGNALRSNPWSDFRLVLCSDGKARRIGPDVFPLAYGLQKGVAAGRAWRKGLARSASRARVGILKGSGNAIVPELAAEFVRAAREAIEDMAVK